MMLNRSKDKAGSAQPSILTPSAISLISNLQVIPGLSCRFTGGPIHKACLPAA